MNMNAEALIAERGQTHGSFAENARISRNIKAMMQNSPGWDLLSSVQHEVLDMVALKVSRILSGNPNEADHWRDIAGYATLAVKEIEGAA